MRLEASQVVLVPLQFTDANDFHQAVRESITELKEQFKWAEDPYTLRHAQAIVQESIAHQRDGMSTTFGIRTKTGKFLGALTLRDVPDLVGRKVPMYQVEVWVRTADAGQGYRAQALQLATDHALRDMGARRVFAAVSSADTATLDAYRQAGYVAEGTCKNARVGGDVVMVAKTV